MDWPDKPVELTDAEYGEFIAGYPVAVVDFWGPNCIPCRMIAPLLDSMAGEMKGKAAFGKVDVTKNLKTATGLRIRSIPTLAFYKDGQLKNTVVGKVDRTRIIMELRELM